MNKITFFLLFSCSLPLNSMQKLKEGQSKISPLTLTEMRGLQDPENAPSGCCTGNPKKVLKRRCQQEAESVKHSLGKMLYKEMINKWSDEDLQSLIPFLTRLQGDETTEQLCAYAHHSFDAGDCFAWFEEDPQTKRREVLENGKPKQNYYLDLYDKNALQNIQEEGLTPKAHVGIGMIRMSVYLENSYQTVLLGIPQFIAVFVAEKGSKLLPVLTIEED